MFLTYKSSVSCTMVPLEIPPTKKFPRFLSPQPSLMSSCRRATATVLIFLVSGLLFTGTDAIHGPKNYASAANQFMGPQNAARSAVGMRPLVWDAKLASYAESYASQRRNDCALRHSNGPYGENIFWGSGKDWSPAQAAYDWVAERRWYDHRSNTCGGGRECGHYTQIVWRQTKRVGCARVTCYGGRGVFMTCNYYPPGNYMGERPY